MSIAICNFHLRRFGKAYPRTCQECQLGPCKYPEEAKAALIEGEGRLVPTAGEGDTAETPNPKRSPLVTSCSVRVMKSFDYCHFEITLGGEAPHPGDFITAQEVDDLRKKAARLADKAVEQYKVAKKQLERREALSEYSGRQMQKDFERIDAIAETDRTPEQMAEWKQYKNLIFQANRCFNYEDDWHDEPDHDHD